MACLGRAAAVAVVAVAAAPPTLTLRNGVEMPMIAAGTWQYSIQEAYDSVTAALKAGFTLIDTAHDYNNQDGVGRAIADSGMLRTSVFLETKVPGCGFNESVTAGSCYSDTKATLEDDLRQLKMEYVDLVLIHFPPKKVMLPHTCRGACDEIRQQWKAMEEFYHAGKARAIGVSNYCPSCFSCLDGYAAVMPMVNQVGYHIGMGANPGGFRAEADRRGIVLQGYSVLGNTPERKAPDPEILHGNFTTSLAQAHNKSTVQVALKYLVQLGVPPVTKSANPAHLAADLDLWSWNLTADEMKRAGDYRHPGLPSFVCSDDGGEGGEGDELVV